MSGTLLDPLPAGHPTQQPAPGPRQSPDQDQAPAPGRPATLYGCFSCAWCYLASQRSDLAGPAAGYDWRMVVPSRHLPVTGVRFDAAGHQHLQDELTTIRALLQPGEVLPADAPGFLPNTGPAVAGYAEAYGAGVAGPVRRLLFDAYWTGGADIGNPEVLRRLLAGPIRAGHSTSWPLRDSGYAVSLAGGPITTEAYHHIRDWHKDWQLAAGGTVPALVAGGSTVTGTGVLVALGSAARRKPLAAPASAAGGGPGRAHWVPDANQDSFLPTDGPVYEGTGSISATGQARPTLAEPGRPDGEVAT